MKIVKRIILFLTINFIILMTLSIIMSLFNIRPYISSYGIDYKSLLIFSLIWGMGGACISLLLSRKIAKMFMRIQIVKEGSREHQKLYRMVEKISRDAMLTKMPEVGVFSSNSP